MVDGVDRESLRCKYVETIIDVAGGAPVLIPTIEPSYVSVETLEAILERIVTSMDLIVLTGDESNIEPYRYNSQHDENNTDPSRDNVALALIKICIKHKTPLLGICRGIQEINVALGGTLQPSLAQLDKCHIEDLAKPRDEQYRPVHYIRIHDGGVLSDIYENRRLKVNSLHNQAILEVAEELFVEATSDDGVVESVSFTKEGNFVLGVQWHPEWHASNEQDARTFFEALFAIIRSRPISDNSKLRIMDDETNSDLVSP
jgi:putative glutamine amidotransferase